MHLIAQHSSVRAAEVRHTLSHPDPLLLQFPFVTLAQVLARPCLLPFAPFNPTSSQAHLNLEISVA